MVMNVVSIIDSLLFLFERCLASILISSGRLKTILDEEETDYEQELALLHYEQHLEWSRRRLDIYQQRVLAQNETDKAFLQRKLQQRELYGKRQEAI